METTLTINGELYEELRLRAEAEELPLEEFADKVIRTGLRTAATKAEFKQQTFKMGAKFNVDKAQAFADSLYDDEVIRKLKQGP